MISFSQYDKATGAFTSQIYTGRRQPNETDTHGWMGGIFNHLRERVDISTGAVVPMDIIAAASDPQRPRRRLLAQINELERKQARRVREVLAASDPALQAIDEEISALRATLNGTPGLTDG